MTLDANSTIAQVLAAYDDNASYEENGSVAQAKAFVTAVRRLMREASRERKGGASGAELEFDMRVLRDEMKDARRFIEANRTDGSPAVLDVDFSEFDSRT